MNIIEIINVNKNYGNKIIFKDIDLSIKEGQCIGIMGENGVGKSVLFKMIAGIEDVSSGKILVRNKVVGKDKNFPTNIGIFINQPNFVDIYSGFKNLKLLAEINNKIDDIKITDTMTKLNLNPYDKTKVKNYSTGMKQKLGIAQAIMENQDVILLDEPFNALDSDSNFRVIEIIKELKNEGKTIMLTSHQQDYLNVLCDDLYLVKDFDIIRYNKDIVSAI